MSSYSVSMVLSSWEPRNRSLLFIPKLTSCSFVGQDYLLIPGSEGLLRELYNDVRASLYGSA